MAKKQKETKEVKKVENKTEEVKQEIKIPENLKKTYDELKPKLDKFTEEANKKFEKYIMGITMLPPPHPSQLPPEMPAQPGQPAPPQRPKDAVDLLILVDDSEPSKISKMEMLDKLTVIMEEVAKGIDPRIQPKPLLLSELWQNCFDAKYDLLQLISMSAPIFDRGMLAAVKIAELHKTMVLKKFEKYIVAYVLAGSLVQGRATPQSDIDVYIVVDDTDVKKMTRFELKDKLRAIIIGMGIEAGAMTGIQNKINIQVYILTDFWESIKEANPVIFTFLRDGVPFYDRGIFMPWKQLLRMGKIKPSPEAIDTYMSSGEQGLERVRFKLKDIGMEEFFWSILTPSQAALMHYGVPPPAPKETADLLRTLFVTKEKFMKEEDVKVLEDVIKTRKDMEHGTKQYITGKEIDDLYNRCQNYLKVLKELFAKIQTKKDEESIMTLYDTVSTTLRDVLKYENIERVGEDELIHVFEEEIISTNKLPSKFLRNLHDLMKAKHDYVEHRLDKTDIDKVRKSSSELLRVLIEYLQRKRSEDIKKVRIRVKIGERYGEIVILGNQAFINEDLDKPRPMKKAALEKDGSFGTLMDATPEELEQALANTEIPKSFAIKPKTYESVEKIFGKDVEILA